MESDKRTLFPRGFRYSIFLLRSFSLVTGLRQLNVNSLLTLLSSMMQTKNQTPRRDGEKIFSIVGVTMEDLYDEDPDLFVAGMAAGGSKVQNTGYGNSLFATLVSKQPFVV